MQSLHCDNPERALLLDQQATSSDMHSMNLMSNIQLLINDRLVRWILFFRMPLSNRFSIAELSRT